MAKPKPPSFAAESTAAPPPAPPGTVHSALVTYTSMLALLSLCPPFVILL
jgi:7-dehydrocholesterol reductase